MSEPPDDRLSDGGQAGPEADPIEAMRREILAATLAHVPFDGWSIAALRAGARDAGYADADALRAFPRGAIDVIELHSRLADERMLSDLAAMDLAAMKVRERVAAAIRVRIEPHTAERESIRRALTVLALPQNAGVAARSLYRTVDAIWWGIGDASTDFSFYTKRAMLAGVFSATVLYWLDDRSPDCRDTWGFLDRRIADVMRIPKVQAEIGRMLGRLPRPSLLSRRVRRRRPRGYGLRA